MSSSSPAAGAPPGTSPRAAAGRLPRAPGAWRPQAARAFARAGLTTARVRGRQSAARAASWSTSGTSGERPALRPVVTGAPRLRGWLFCDQSGGHLREFETSHLCPFESRLSMNRRVLGSKIETNETELRGPRRAGRPVGRCTSSEVDREQVWRAGNGSLRWMPASRRCCFVLSSSSWGARRCTRRERSTSPLDGTLPP